MSKALTVAVDERQLFFMLFGIEYYKRASSKGNESANISGGEEETEGIGILFLRVVESIFVANLMLTMMLAYNDGNIVAVIKTRILAHEGIKNRFSSLSGCDNNDDNQLLMGYILERYANMQGMFLSSILREILVTIYKTLQTVRQQGQKWLMG
jgi:hypothetical protein